MKFFLKRLLYSFIVLLLFTAPAFSKSLPATLIVAQQTDPKTLDPAASNDVYSHNVSVQIYDRLFEWSDQMQIEPSLAESWTQKDPLTLNVKLKKGVKFHNGDDFTAEDVKFSLERSSKAPGGMTYFGNLDRVDIINPYEVDIVTKSPYGPMLSSLAHGSGSILNKKYVENGDKEVFFEPIGTGPFIFESWKSGDRIVMKANKDYFAGAPATDGIIFRNIPETTSRTIALETGEIDMVLSVDPIDMTPIEENPNLVLVAKPSVALNYIGFNNEKGPTSDIRVRQAIALAINQTDIVDTAFVKRAIQTVSVIPPSILGYEEIPPYEINIEKAKKLLAEAGYPDGFKLRFWTNENQSRKDTAVILQEQLKAINVDMSIEILEWSAYLEKLGKAEHDIYMLGWPGSADPDGCVYPLFHSKSSGTAGNMAFYKNARVDELLDKGRASVDPAERAAAYKEAARIIHDEVGVYVLAIPPVSLGYQKYIEGFFAYPTFVHFFRKVKKNLK